MNLVIHEILKESVVPDLIAGLQFYSLMFHMYTSDGQPDINTASQKGTDLLIFSMGFKSGLSSFPFYLVIKVEMNAKRKLVWPGFYSKYIKMNLNKLLTKIRLIIP